MGSSSDVTRDVNSDTLTPKSGESWVVGCKFIRDVANFNEWGVDVEYFITQL